MDKKTISLIIKILKITTSVVLCVTATVSMLGATLISVARDYLESEEFHNQIDSTDLGTVKFLVNNEKITVNDYARELIADYLKDKMPSYFPFQNYAVDAVISSQAINTAVKNEVYNLVDYFLNSNVKDAEYRIENGVTIQNNEEFNIDNAKTIEDAISIYARKFVLQSIENVSGMSTDKLIILISEQTVSKLITLAVILLIILVAINITTIFNLLLYGGFVGVLYGAVIKIAQNKFDQWNAGLEDLVGYVFLKPLADAYSPNATTGFIVGIILIALFIGVYFLFKNFVNKDKTKEQK